MKIVDVVAHVLSTQLEEPFAFSQGWVRRRSAVVVEVVSDEGVTGWGESLCHGLQPPEVAASYVEFCYKPMLVGSDPFDAEVLWEELYNRTRPFGDGAAVNVLSGVDIALWDAVGRSLSLPVHKLLGGGFRSELTPYATGTVPRPPASTSSSSPTSRHRTGSSPTPHRLPSRGRREGHCRRQEEFAGDREVEVAAGLRSAAQALKLELIEQVVLNQVSGGLGLRSPLLCHRRPGRAAASWRTRPRSCEATGSEPPGLRGKPRRGVVVSSCRRGSGTRMFELLGGEHIQLETTSVIETPAAIHLRFCIVK